MAEHHERIHHDEAYRDDPGETSPEMTPGHGEPRPPRREGEGAASVLGMGFGVPASAFAGEIERNELDEEQDERTPGHVENHDQGVDSVP